MANGTSSTKGSGSAAKVAPQAQPQAASQPAVQTQDTSQPAAQPFVRAQRSSRGMDMDTFNSLPDAQKAALITHSLSQSVPDHLNNTSDLQKFMYTANLGGMPDVVSDSQLDSMQGTEMFRTVNNLYNSTTDINLTAPQMADSLTKSRQTYFASNATGGAAYGEGIYFATKRSDSTAYGNVTGNITKTAVVRAKMKPGTRTISYATASSGASNEIKQGTQLGKALKGMNSQARPSAYALCKGYQALTSGHSYVNVIDRSCLVISDKYTAK